MKLNKMLLALLFVLTVVGVSTNAQTGEQKEKKETPQAENKTEDRTKKETAAPIATRKKGDQLIFPDVEGWEKASVVTYPHKELGYSQNYDLPDGGRVSIYVYNGGRSDIRNSLSGAVAEEIDRAKAEIMTIAEMGYYTEVKELKSETATISGNTGKLKALKKTFNYKQDGTLLYSELFVLPFEGNFLKIRATREANVGNETKEAFGLLLKNLEDFLLKYMETAESESLAVNL